MPRISSHDRRFLARVHFWLLGFSLLGYLIFVFTLGPGFLSFDVAHKIRAVADELIVVTATVLGPPASPTLTATPVCVSGSPRINLDWADDAATTSWDIERDSAPLVTGLTSSAYVDTAVSSGVSYRYVVTAYGPMSPGIAASSEVTATALDCSTVLPRATVTIQTVGEEDITASRRMPVKVRKERPRISGTTNMPEATISIVLTRPTFRATLTANANGYFNWKPSRDLHPGRHTLTVTATDPTNSNRTATETLTFRTVAIDAADDTDETVALAPTEAEVELPPAAFDFSLAIKNTHATLRQGDQLIFTVKPVRGLFPADTVFKTNFLDERGKEIYTPPNYKVTADNRSGFDWVMEVPRYIPEHTYQLQVTAFFGEATVTHTAAFTVTALPFLYTGNEQVITYAEVAHFLGWILFTVLTLFTLFFLFLLREYWLYLHGLRHITERELTRLGLISPLRKGVRK